jgi:hypothetical protein
MAAAVAAATAAGKIARERANRWIAMSHRDLPDRLSRRDGATHLNHTALALSASITVG